MKKTLPFILITCLISWLAAGIFYFAVENPTTGTSTYNLFAMLYMLFPAIVAILLQKLLNKEAIVKPFMISFRINRWFLVALVTPLLIIFVSIGVNLLFPNVQFTTTGEGMIERYSSTMPAETLDAMRTQMENINIKLMILITVVQGFLAACTINGLFALGEELGWRGYMLHHMRNYSFIKVSLLTGAIWGIWHFPLILMGHNYPNHPVIGVLFMVIFCTLLSPMMTYIVIKSKSVITAAVFHGSMNAFAGLPLIFLVGGNDLTNGFQGLAGFITTLIFTFGFFIFDKYITKEGIFSKTVLESLAD
ncbi:CPBP family intramembrane metalloprotease [Paludibacteraceae bacterium OttesenSCG-928-F17]|nr:CPBP family intramembrane metalloprotease [Paludibacteraceae bacterium OttesenSCG-928-F17]